MRNTLFKVNYILTGNATFLQMYILMKGIPIFDHNIKLIAYVKTKKKVFCFFLPLYVTLL